MKAMVAFGGDVEDAFYDDVVGAVDVVAASAVVEWTVLEVAVVLVLQISIASVQSLTSCAETIVDVGVAAVGTRTVVGPDPAAARA